MVALPFNLPCNECGSASTLTFLPVSVWCLPILNSSFLTSSKELSSICIDSLNFLEALAKSAASFSSIFIYAFLSPSSWLSNSPNVFLCSAGIVALKSSNNPSFSSTILFLLPRYDSLLSPSSILLISPFSSFFFASKLFKFCSIWISLFKEVSKPSISLFSACFLPILSISFNLLVNPSEKESIVSI